MIILILRTFMISKNICNLFQYIFVSINYTYFKKKSKKQGQENNYFTPEEDPTHCGLVDSLIYRRMDRQRYL